MDSQIVGASVTGLALGLALLAGCASGPPANGRDGTWGSYGEEEIEPGLFRLTASNGTPFMKFTAARSTWSKRADQLCGTDAYTSFDAKEGHTEPRHATAIMPINGLFIPYDVEVSDALITGYVLCNATGLTIEQAQQHLADLLAASERKEKERLWGEIDLLGGSRCELDTNSSASACQRRATMLLQLGEFQLARACLERAARSEPGSEVAQQASQQLGLMYELGMGVEPDMAAAMRWYEEAGLR